MTIDSVDVAVVGGGPAGALTAMRLAQLGHAVALFERAPRWRWRACGVFASPAAVTALRDIGIGHQDLAALARPVRAMEVQSRRGVRFALTYGGSGDLSDSAVGFDRRALDGALLDRAEAAGVAIYAGTTVTRVVVSPDLAVLTLRDPDGDPATTSVTVRARIVIGADGIRSIVAGSVGEVRRAPIASRAALTFHVPDVGLGDSARMVVIQDGYCGLAPVPDNRVNVGIVLGRSWFGALRREGGPAVAARVLTHVLGHQPPEPLDRVAGVTPLAHAVGRRAGDSWLLVGDAAGFLDPLTGEGLHRALRSAELAAAAAHDVLAGKPGASLTTYDRTMADAFTTKDVVSRILQAFLGRPALFEYAARRLAARSRVRDTMGLVMGDLIPASRALDPRYLAALLRP